MLPLEGQVCSLELAKKLKELGVKQSSLVAWAEYPHVMQQKKDGTSECIETITEIRGTSYWRQDEIDSWSAFTVAELGEMLPDCIIFNENYYYIKSQKKDNEFKIYLDSFDKVTIFFDTIEANARAKVLIYLIENNLLSIDEINKALNDK